VTHEPRTADHAEDAEVAPRRRYRSPLRDQQAQQTRAALLAAATRLFTTRGWAATGMRDIAREAGVATETLYAHFSSKARLLQRVIDIAVVGDEAAVRLADRPEFAALGQGSRSERIAAAARLVTGVNVRTAGFAKVLRQAAPTDDAMAESLEATRERQRRDVAAGVELVIGRRPTAVERDGVWALLSPEVYLLLVEASGWSPEQYEAWVAEALGCVIPAV
jgi:AcrR family transcriptional regulator